MPSPDTRIRLTVVLTHPVQYYAPWFRHMTANEPRLDLTVLYATTPTPRQQGVGFDAAFTWDVPLAAGYSSRVVSPPSDSHTFDAAAFRGVDVPEIGTALLETRPDVVLLPGWQSITLVRALAAARRGGIPVLYRGDTHLGNAPSGWRRTVWRFRSRMLLRRFAAYLAVGVAARDYLMDIGVDHRRVFRAPHAVDNERFAHAAMPFQTAVGRRAARDRFGVGHDAFVVAIVGKLDPIKRPLDAVRAVARLGGRAALLVAGSGALEQDLRAEAARLGVAVSMPGFVNQADLPAVYAAADCLAVPSRVETWGLVINEAMATGLPVVATEAVGAAADLVDDGTGATFPVGDVDRCAEALARIRDRGSDEYAPACRDRIRRYDFAAATAGVVEACRFVLEREPRPAAAVRVVACCGNMVQVTGLERHTFHTLRVFREGGAAVHCIVNSWEHRRIVPLAEEIGATWSVGAYFYPIRRRRLTARQVAGTLVEIVRTSGGLLRDVRRTRATAVIVPDHVVTIRNAAALAWFRLRGHVRVVAHLGNPPDSGTFYRFYWRYFQHALIDEFVSNSAYSAGEVAACGIPPGKVSYVYNVLPPGRRVAQPAPWSSRIPGRIAFVGQIIPEKGLDLLLEAVALVRARGVDASLDVVGDIDGWTTPEYREYRRQLRARAAARDLAGHVNFLGWREDVPAVLGRVSLHCIPSRLEQKEGFGFVTLEAKECGVPTVALPSGALPELVVHRVNGWVASAFTADALAEGLEYFLGDPERLRAAGLAARAAAATFEPDEYARAWWQVVTRTGQPVAESPVPKEVVGS